jgi:AsmA protein
MMKKFARIAGIVVAAVLILLLVLAALAKILITPERVRKTVLPLAEKALHRPVQLGEIQVSIFSGILLKKLMIAEKDGGEPFVAAEQVKLRYQFWPLLSRRVVIDEVTLESPRIHVVRLPDGTFNFSDITAKKEEKQPEAPKKEMDLLVSKIGVTGGELRYEDRKGETPHTTTITAIEFSSSEVSKKKPFPFSAGARVTGASVVAKGKADISGQPAIDLNLKLDADLAKLVTALPPELALKAKPYAPAGGIAATLHLAGPTAAPKELLKGGEVTLKALQVTASGQRPVLEGDLALTADSVATKNLILALGPNKLNIKFQVQNLLKKPMVITSTVTADRFDLDPFLKKGGAPAPVPAPAKTAARQAAKPEPGPLNLPVNASGTVQLGQIAYKGLPITRLLLKYRLVDNLLYVDGLSGNVAGGAFSETARIDLRVKGFTYTTRLNVTGVKAEPIVAAFAPKAAGTVFGTLAMNADLKGAGTGEAMKKTLSGRGDFTITDGKLTGPGLVQELARFLNVEQLRVLQFVKFGGNFTMDKGKVLIDSSVTGRDLQMTPKGSAGLDKSLNLSLETRIGPQLSSSVTRGAVGKFITDDKGWTLIPLKVGGTFSAPAFRLDTAMVREQVKSKAKEKLQQTIQDKLLKKKEGEPQRPEQELLEKGLKGIFGK